MRSIAPLGQRLRMVPLSGVARAQLARYTHRRREFVRALRLPWSLAQADAVTQSALEIGLSILSSRARLGAPPQRSRVPGRLARTVIDAEQLAAARALLARFSSLSTDGPMPSLSEILTEALTLGIAALEAQRNADLAAVTNKATYAIAPITTTLSPRMFRTHRARLRTPHHLRRARAARRRRTSRRRRPPRGTRDANASDGPPPGAFRALIIISRRAPS